jgi:vacuolar-type H+-ATPase subunit F/Vma7
MGEIVFIGDELTAAGMRLAGVAPVLQGRRTAAEALAEARQSAVLVLITAEFARKVPAAELAAALIAEAPVLAVIPDINGHATPPDLTKELMNALGIET